MINNDDISMKVLPKRTFGWIIVLLCTAGFILTDQGRILSPDTEIVFRAGEHLAQNGDLSVPYDLEGWKGFGVAKGVDGKLYSVFGPLESVVLAPFIKIASAINGTGWYTSIPESLPLSYQVDDGLQKTFIHAQTQYPEPHALRLIVSLLYLSVSILGVYVFWLIACKILSNELAVFLCSLLYAFGTIVWNYSGTLFSEPLAILFVLLSLHTLISCDPSFAASSDNSSMWRQLVGGIFIGLAVAAHITAMIIVPFFVFYCFAISYSKKKSILFAARPLSMFIVGVGTVLLLLGYYNFIRFGDFFQTGRTVHPDDVKTFGYGYFVAPWIGLYGLLLSPSKGLFIYCPAIVLGLMGWKSFHKTSSALSWTFSGIVLSRILFIASRSDWHGGFCLGPRFLLMIIPFMLLPAGCWIQHQLGRKSPARLAALGGAFFLCIAQQFYFCIGEVFSSYYLLAHQASLQHINPFTDNHIYLDFAYAPVLHLFAGWRGPFLLQQIPLSNEALTIVGIAALGILVIIGCIMISRYSVQKDFTA